MAKTKQTGRARRKQDEAEALAPQARGASASAGPELEDLDAFIEKVLEEAGEEFLDEFRQIEGE
ncbi:MAG: hypothetical protein P1P84_09170 [Deferrisomatales bacterium]|nr:hypothetical protein [Deferrisomatales bacterium]